MSAAEDFTRLTAHRNGPDRPPPGWEPGHIVNHETGGKPQEGGFRSFSLAEAPPEVIDIAVRAARCIGDGLYGVDLKETPDGVVVIEVNDNPNLEHGVEDAAEKDAVWMKLTQWFIDRLERQG